MSQLAADIPELVGKPLKMINSRTFRLKAILASIALLLSVYFLLAFKTIYQKNKKLDHIMEMTVETEQKMLKVHRLDQNLAMELVQVDNGY